MRRDRIVPLIVAVALFMENGVHQRSFLGFCRSI
jgi:hypothetical protein